MSDLRLFNLKTNKILDKQRYDKQSIRKLIESNLDELIGIKLIALDYQITTNPFDAIEVLGYDENYQLVVIEYRVGKFTSTINKGLFFLDYLKNNPSKVKILLNEKLGYEISNQINITPRLISIGDDYNQYDQYAIQKIPFSIDLVKYQIFDKNLLLLEKNFHSKKIVINNHPFQIENEDDYNLYKVISEFILSLGDEVCEVHQGNFIAYRKIKNFIYLMYDHGIELKLKMKTYKTIKIKTIKGFEKAQRDIETCYDEN